MAELGRGQYLQIVRWSPNGAFLDGAQLGEILLPNAEVPDGADVGDEVEVFISRDSEDRLVATTTFPRAQVGEFAVLKVAAIEPIGAFLDWGLPKDLFLPFREQTRDLKVGDLVVVYVGLDARDRLVASMKVTDFTESDPPPEGFVTDTSVRVLICGSTDLGYKAIVNGAYEGLLFRNEVHQPLRYAQEIDAFIKRVRPDGKIDLSLRPTGQGSNKTLVDETAQKILKHLEDHGGFAALTDKTPADEIYRLFGVSKKKFKIALGGLYKARRVQVEERGVRLTSEEAAAAPSSRDPEET